MTYQQFIDEIMNYESDTFNAPNLKLKRKRAGKIARKCLDYFVNNRLDGCLLSDFFEETKGE